MSEANSKLSPEQEKELLEKYAPVMRFSAGERFFPTKVNDYVNNCHALVDGKTQDWIEGPEIKDLVEKDDPESYLWFVEPSPFDRKFRLWKQRVSQRLPRIDKRTLKLFLIISGAFVLCILLVLSLPNLITARNDVATFAIAIDGDGHKWVGTDGGRVSEFDGTKWTT